ncbi:MAG: TVP38/TMEM64 family protein [Syntrophales bacterium]
MIDRKAIIKLAILILFVSIGTYIFLHLHLYVYFISKKKAINFITSFYPYDVIVFIAMQVLQVVFAPIPGEATGLIGGYLYGPFFGTVYSTIGLTAGSWLAFVLGRFFGLPFVERAVKPEILQKYDYLLEHKGALVSFVLFLIPGFPKDYLCYILGLSHLRVWTFLAISATGRLFGTVLLSVCGSYARTNRYAALSILVGASGLAILIAYLYREKWLEMAKKRKK